MVRLKITPKKFAEAKEQFDQAVQDRKGAIADLYFEQHWTQQAIADLFHIDIAQVNRFVRKIEKEREKTG